MGTTTWSPLASGALTGKYLEGVPDGSRASLKGYEWLRKHMIDSDRGQERMKKVSAYIDIAKNYSLDPIKLAIAWCLLNKNVSTVILGASNTMQLEDNLKCLDYMKEFSNSILSLHRYSKRAIAIITDTALCILCTWIAFTLRLEEFILFKHQLLCLW